MTLCNSGWTAAAVATSDNCGEAVNSKTKSRWVIKTAKSVLRNDQVSQSTQERLPPAAVVVAMLCLSSSSESSCLSEGDSVVSSLMGSKNGFIPCCSASKIPGVGCGETKPAGDSESWPPPRWAFQFGVCQQETSKTNDFFHRRWWKDETWGKILLEFGLDLDPGQFYPLVETCRLHVSMSQKHRRLERRTKLTSTCLTKTRAKSEVMSVGWYHHTSTSCFTQRSACSFTLPF